MTSEIDDLKSAGSGLLKAIGCPNPPHIRLLVLEDSNADFKLLTTKLEQVSSDCYTLAHVTTADDAFIALRDGGHDAALVDYKLPGKSGVDFIMAAAKAGYHCPFILWSAYPFQQSQLEMIKQMGAVGFIDKSQDAKSTDAAIRSAVGNFRQFQQQNISVATNSGTEIFNK